MLPLSADPYGAVGAVDVQHRAVGTPVMPGTLSTAGMPSSRETIAAWLWIAPVSHTTAAAPRNNGVHDGSVIAQTSTSPGSRPRGSDGIDDHPRRP